ncbi:hypothetical protein ABIA33_002770 [Streptacidiphilus sp. MAP12-16]
MYALIIPAALPFVLLGIVMGLSWWEDRLLPRTGPRESPVETHPTSAVPVPTSQRSAVPASLTQAGGGR